ncbi:hypothetical protein QCA50_015663 [Cerrena zonata]|uniref:Uncharacterized protein n=1 Tax=Cerrena zonata TaxID=2478898 RepID=A0AAW0FKZ5_9APHY
MQNPETCRTAVLNTRKTLLKKSKSKKSNKKYKKLDEENQMAKEKENELLAEVVDPEAELDQLMKKV